MADPEGESSIPRRVLQHQALLLPYTDTIIIEVDHVTDFPPSQFALDALKQTVEDVTQKMVILIEPQPIDGTAEIYSRDQVMDLHYDTFDHRSDSPNIYEGAATLHILYLNGDYESPLKYNGAYLYERDPVIIILQERIQTVPGAEGSPMRTQYALEKERQVVIHETGHALGLVNMNIPMVTSRVTSDECRCHSADPDSVMGAWDDVRANDLEQWVLSEVDLPWQFNQHDLEDIRAFQAAHHPG